jgi:heterodisulfide reductase subunit A
MADEGGLIVQTRDPITGEDVVIHTDLLVLNTGIEPSDSRELAAILDLPLDDNGFFLEEHPKMRPLDFTRPGIYVSGLAHSPRSVDETIEQAKGAAMRAAVVLRRRLTARLQVAIHVDPQLCAACEQCVAACPFGARAMTEDALYVRVIDELCQACGTCVAVCPNKAVQPYSWAPAQVLAMTDQAERASVLA